MLMHVTLNRTDTEILASIHGEVDADNCDELGTILTRDTTGAPELIIDLSQLGFIDSSGISELLKVAETVRGRGQALQLRDPSPAVHRVLEITGLLDHFGLT